MMTAMVNIVFIIIFFIIVLLFYYCQCRSKNDGLKEMHSLAIERWVTLIITLLLLLLSKDYIIHNINISNIKIFKIIIFIFRLLLFF